MKQANIHGSSGMFRRLVSHPAAWWVPALLLFSYVAVRTFTVGITYDEAWTLRDFAPQPLAAIITGAVPDANNHILNTLWVKLVLQAGMNELAAARTLSLISLIPFLLFSALICRRFMQAVAGYAAYLFLILNPWLYDFFGLARGYAPALACTLGALYFLLLWMNQKRTSYLILCMVLLWLMTAANFSFLVVAGAVFIIVFAFGVYGCRQKHCAGVMVVLLPAAAGTVLSFYPALHRLQLAGALYYGGIHDPLRDTMFTVARYALYRSADGITVWTTLIVAVASIGLLIVLMFRRKMFPDWPQLLISGLPLLCLMIVTVLHYLFRVPYPTDRAAIYLIPLGVIAAGFLAGDIYSSVPLRLLSLTWLLAAVVNFISHAGFHATASWFYDAHTREVLGTLNRIPVPGQTVKVDFSWPFERSVDYYLRREDHQGISIVNRPEKRGEVNPGADYYIYLGDSLEFVGYQGARLPVLLKNADTLIHYPSVRVTVFRMH